MTLTDKKIAQSKNIKLKKYKIPTLSLLRLSFKRKTIKTMIAAAMVTMVLLFVVGEKSRLP
ncbi:protein of unknown function [Chryseobacterium sp. JV274]|nr:protein of unknown function [Chryseobacterium sp. JV274]